MNLTREEILKSKEVHLFDETTIYVVLDDDCVYGLHKGSGEWFRKNNFYDYFDSELMLTYFSYITKEDAAALATEWIETSLLKKEESAERNRERLSSAIIFATERHSSQYRKGTTIPYIVHPMEVLSILIAMKADTDLLIAGVLHDTVEDTETTIEEIKTNFGTDVARLVGEHSEDKSKTWKERKEAAYSHACSAETRAKKLILADKLSNLRSIHRDYMALGNALWNRFNAGREQQSWYYGKMTDALVSLTRDKDAEAMYWELVALYKDVFVTFYLDRGKSAMYQDNGAGEKYKLTKAKPEWVAYDKPIPKEAIVVERVLAEKLEDGWADPYGEVLFFDLEEKQYNLFSSTSRSLSISIIGNTLRFSGEDFGEECLLLHGTKEYEFYYTLKEEATYLFLTKLRKKHGLQKSLDSILKNEFGGDEGAVKFTSFCRRNKIEYSTWVL